MGRCKNHWSSCGGCWCRCCAKACCCRSSCGGGCSSGCCCGWRSSWHCCCDNLWCVRCTHCVQICNGIILKVVINHPFESLPTNSDCWNLKETPPKNVSDFSSFRFKNVGFYVTSTSWTYWDDSVDVVPRVTNLSMQMKNSTRKSIVRTK